MNHSKRTARLALLIAVATTALLLLTPLGRTVGYPLWLMATFVHELGHGVAAWWVGADFQGLAIHLDGSGVARIAGPLSGVEKAVVAFGGLLGPAIAAALLFPLVVRPWLSRIGLLCGGLGSLVAGFTVVENAMGWLVVAVLTVGGLATAARAGPLLAQTVLAIVAVQLGASIFANADQLFAPVAQTAQGSLPSDVAVVSQAIPLPHWLWGMLTVCVSALVLAWGVRTFWRATGDSPVGRGRRAGGRAAAEGATDTTGEPEP